MKGISRVVIRDCDLLGKTFFAVSLGESDDDFFEKVYGGEKEREIVRHEAIDAAVAKAKELGLGRDAIVFEILTDKVEAA